MMADGGGGGKFPALEYFKHLTWSRRQWRHIELLKCK